MSDAATPGTITGLLRAIHEGDRSALGALVPLVYDELMVLARRQRQRFQDDLSLNTTAVVHEAYLKLAAQHELPAESRSHFLAVAAMAMRHILCNHARDRRAIKRGAGATHVPLEEWHDAPLELDLDERQTEELAALGDALQRLESLAARQAQIVECRFFGGMSVEETATALGISARTVKREWSFARAWLRREMHHALQSLDSDDPWTPTGMLA